MLRRGAFAPACRVARAHGRRDTPVRTHDALTTRLPISGELSFHQQWNELLK